MAAGQVTPGQIARMAQAHGLDPNAVLAVAKQEGLGGGVGDQGTSFGPWQLHEGGALPQGIANPQQWAWSPAGVTYALSRIANVAKGLHGSQAVNAIVSRFERPANPGKEIAGALAAYGGAPVVQPPAAMPVQPGRTVNPRAPMAGGQNKNIAAALKLLGFAAPAASEPVAPVEAPAPLRFTPPANTRTQVQATPLPDTRLVAGNTQGENTRFLQDLARLAGYEGKPVQINSGFRSRAKQAELYANRASNPNPVAPPGSSLHEQGLAADGTVGGVPLGTLPPKVLAMFGLAPVPGDPVHVQVARGR